jgi:tubulin polyglutamylase TTLL6/13
MSNKNKEEENSGSEDIDEEESNNSSDDQDESSEESEDSPTTNGKGKKKKSIKKPKKKKAKQTLVYDVSDTQYDVVKFVGRKIFGWKLTYDPDSEWDVRWTDNAVQPETLAKMQEYQRINHFPGMYSLARKNHLGRHLMRMRKAFPEKFKFFPPTWLLPTEFGDFKAQFTKSNDKTFIIKPEASSQGRGIFLTKAWEAIQPGEHYVAQRYLTKPYLIDGLKFDLRIYVLLAGCDPLRVYLYHDGLGRFATEEYVQPTGDNLDNVCMHLTNYAINKDNPNFVFNENADNDDVGHKRSLKAVLRLLEEQGHDVKTLWEEIKKIIIKTFCSVQPILAHSYKSCHPDEPYNNMCFELLGFDIMLDYKLKPWLIEVNHTPSFTTDTPLDRNIKKGAIKDALKLMNCTVEQKMKVKNKKQNELRQRVLTGKKVRITPEERQAAFEQAQKERDVYEAKHCGDYEKIYPLDDPSQSTEDYEEYMKMALKWWEEWTGTSIKRNAKKVQDPNKPLPFVFGSSNYKAKEQQNAPKQKVTPKPPSTQKIMESSPSEPKITATGTTARNNELASIQDLGPLEQIQEDDRDFLEHVAALTSEDRMVKGEDDQIQTTQEIDPEDVEKVFPHYSLVQSVAALSKIEGKLGDTYAEPEDSRQMNSGQYFKSPQQLGSPSRQDSARNNPNFRIRTHHQNNNPPVTSSKTPIEQSQREGDKILFSRKYTQNLTQNFALVQNGSAQITSRNENLNPKSNKVPLRLSNGVVGEMGDYRENYDQERGLSNSMFTKGGPRQKETGKESINKKGNSPQTYTQNRYPGNYIQPKLLEFNFPQMKSEEPKMGPGFSVVGSNNSKSGGGRKDSQMPTNFSYYQDQISLQKYYNIFFSNNRKY